jgi:serine protease
LAFGTPSAAYAADTAPPQIVSMTLAPTSVNVATTTQQVRATLHLTDETGVSSVTGTLKSLDTTQVTPVRFGLLFTGTKTDGNWRINFNLPQGAAPGQWQLDVASIVDEAGNRVNVAGIPSSSLPTVAVTSVANPDVDAPVIASMSLAPATVDVGPAARIVTATFHLTDQTGAAHIFGGLKSLDSGQITANKQAVLTSGTAQDGTWQAEYTIPQGASAGQWQLRIITIDDVLTNSKTGLFIPPAELPTVTVTVSHAPDKPTAAHAVAGDSQATVSWTAPADNGSTISGYTVTSSPGSITKSAAGDQTSAVVDGLDNGTSYTFTVVATNENGPGPASDPSNAVTPNAVFTTGPTATITGEPQVGQTLTAHEGTPSPTPDSFGYQWLADGAEIGGATDSTFEVTATQAGKQISVRVTAKRAGYLDASDTSDPVGPVVGHINVATADSVVQGGRTVRVTANGLSPRENYTIKIDGATVKTGRASSRGTVSTSVRVPSTDGEATLRLDAASGSWGSTKLQLVLAKTFVVTADPSTAPKSSTATVTVTGMAPGEALRVTFSGRRISPTGATAASDGTYSQTFNVGTRLGARDLKVRGHFYARTGEAQVVVTP